MSKVEWIPSDSPLTIERDRAWVLSIRSHMVRTSPSISANLCLQLACQSPCILLTIHDSQNFYEDIYLHKQVKYCISFNKYINKYFMIFSMYPFLYRLAEATKKLQPLIFIVSTFYPVRQGVSWENREKLKCCEILSLRICIAPKSILQWSLAKHNKVLASAWLFLEWCHSGGNSEKCRKKSRFILILLCQKMNVASTRFCYGS